MLDPAESEQVDKLKSSIENTSIEIDRVKMFISVYQTAQNTYIAALKSEIQKMELIRNYDQSKCDAEGIEI